MVSFFVLMCQEEGRRNEFIGFIGLDQMFQHMVILDSDRLSFWVYMKDFLAWLARSFMYTQDDTGKV